MCPQEEGYPTSTSRIVSTAGLESEYEGSDAMNHMFLSKCRGLDENVS